MSRGEFVNAFGRLFQGSAWVAEQAYDRRPFTDTHDLRVAFQEALLSGRREDQDELIAHYPDLGADRVAGGEEGEDSVRDQSAAGLTRLSNEDHQRFSELTAAYRERFGIPLIVCVRDVEKRDHILRTGWQRMENSPAQETGVGADRDRQDRQPPVRRPGRRGQPDHQRPHAPVRAAGELTLSPDRDGSLPSTHSSRRTGTAVPEGLGLPGLNALPAPEAEQVLAACCASPRWAASVASGRPYASPGQLYDAADDALADLDDDDIAMALAGHPRIGERPEGGGRCLVQARAGRRQPARRRGHCRPWRTETARTRPGSGTSTSSVRPDAAPRTCSRCSRIGSGNDPVTERAVVRRELGLINRIRLARLVEGAAA